MSDTNLEREVEGLKAARAEGLIEAATRLQDWLMHDSPETFNVPDDVWTPFTDALEVAGREAASSAVTVWETESCGAIAE